MNFRLDYAEIEKQMAKKAEKVKRQKEKPQPPANEKISVARKRVVITGAVPGMTRSQVVDLLNSVGTTVYPSVGRGVDYLIIGNTKGSNTTKMQAASNLGIPTIRWSQVKEGRRY